MPLREEGFVEWIKSFKKEPKKPVEKVEPYLLPPHEHNWAIYVIPSMDTVNTQKFKCAGCNETVDIQLEALYDMVKYFWPYGFSKKETK